MDCCDGGDDNGDGDDTMKAFLAAFDSVFYKTCLISMGFPMKSKTNHSATSMRSNFAFVFPWQDEKKYCNDVIDVKADTCETTSFGSLAFSNVSMLNNKQI